MLSSYRSQVANVTVGVKRISLVNISLLFSTALKSGTFTVYRTRTETVSSLHLTPDISTNSVLKRPQSRVQWMRVTTVPVKVLRKPQSLLCLPTKMRLQLNPIPHLPNHNTLATNNLQSQITQSLESVFRKE